jgi:hypothetical protein
MAPNGGIYSIYNKTKELLIHYPNYDERLSKFFWIDSITFDANGNAFGVSNNYIYFKGVRDTDFKAIKSLRQTVFEGSVNHKLVIDDHGVLFFSFRDGICKIETSLAISKHLWKNFLYLKFLQHSFLPKYLILNGLKHL